VASGGRSGAVSISHAFYANLTGKIASRVGTVAIAVGLADERRIYRSIGGETAVEVRSTVSVSGLASSPLRDGAIGLDVAFDAATTFEVAVRGTGIRAVRVLGTEIDADSGKGIAVRVLLGGGRGTILRYGTSLRAGVFTAIAAETIDIAVKRSSSSQAVRVGSAFNASSSGNVALRLVGRETTIVYAVRVLGASLASLVSHAVVTGTVLFATVVIGRGACA